MKLPGGNMYFDNICGIKTNKASLFIEAPVDVFTGYLSCSLN
jgi:hypothetical protein